MMKGNRCLYGRLSAFFTSNEALREHIVLMVVYSILFIVSLPGKSYFFYISQELVPVSFTATVIGGLIISLLFSLRKGLSAADHEVMYGVGIWLKQEEMKLHHLWIGAVIPAFLHALFLVTLLIPFIVIAGSLSGINLETIGVVVPEFFLIMLFFRSTALFVSVVTGGRLFLTTLIMGFLILMLFLATLVFCRILNPLIILLSARDGWETAAVYGFIGIILFICLRLPLKKWMVRS